MSEHFIDTIDFFPKMTKMYCLSQGCCLTGAWVATAGPGFIKFYSMSPERAPKQRSFHSHVICPMTSIFWWNRSKNHSHNKLNGKQQLLLFCFAFITKNMDQNMATKSLSGNKTAESHIGKSPYNALQAQYWMSIRHVCQWIVPLLMPYWL